MEERYVFNGEDITLDILMKIGHIVRLIATKENGQFDDCLIKFSASNTYHVLQNVDSQLWAESAGFIVDEYYREVQAEE